MKVMAKGGVIVSASGEGTEDEAPTSKLLRRIIEAFAFFERDLIKARTKGAKDAARARGEHIGGSTPIGYDKVANGNGKWKLVDNDKERETIRVARHLREMGQSWSRISEQLTEMGHKPRRAKRWHPTQVRRMCK